MESLKKRPIAYGVAVLAIVFLGGAYFQSDLEGQPASELQGNVETSSFVDEQEVEDDSFSSNSLPTEVVSNSEAESEGGNTFLILKDVGEPFLDRFGLAPADFNNIKAAGVDIIASNFDICSTPSEVLLFLDAANSVDLKVILPAGSGEAEWGYPCDEEFSDDLKPVWQKDRVQEWVKKWSFHPALFAWDISNEDGQNFPNALRVGDEWIDEGFSISVEQLQEAYHDVKISDPTHPVMIRMNGWYFYDFDSDFFRKGNAFGPGIADIVMVNAYSNVDEYFSDFVSTVTLRASSAIKSIEPQAKIIIALGAWEEVSMWVRPSVNNFTNDFTQAKNSEDLLGIAVFKYGAEAGEWWMPRDAADLWDIFSAFDI